MTGAATLGGPAPDGLRRAVVASLGREVSELDWSAAAIDPELRIHSVTGGVLRVGGRADGDPFSVVVKTTRHGVDDDPHALWVSGAEPGHRNYWKREWLAYTSGLLGALPGRLRAPGLLHAAEPADGVATLWLEDVAGRPGERWQPQHYARAAHDLGTTQGAYATGRAQLPDQPWLSRRWLADWVTTTARWWPLVDDDAAWADPRLGGLAAQRAAARAVWAERDRLLELVDAAPQTVVHLDLWPANLIAGAAGRTVALDWSSVGIGAVTQDLDQLTLDPLWMQVRPGADLGLLERAVLPAYAGGLRAAGLAVTDRELRRWYAAAAGLRYTSVLATQADLAADPDRVAGVERRWGRPFEAVAADRAAVVRRAVALAEEALAAGGG